jgi:hypothetical protein
MRIFLVAEAPQSRPMNALREAEQAVLAESREWALRRLTERMQAQANAMESLCPQTGQPLTDTRWRAMSLHTVSGLIALRVRHGYSEALREWVCPARIAWGLQERQRVSPELQARVCYTSTQTGSFEKAAAMAQCWGTEVSDDLIHHHVQQCGAAATQLSLPTPPVAVHEPEFSLVIMMDGWMARERGPDWGVSPRRKAPERIAWHEIKSAVIYRLEQRAQKESGRGLLLEKYIVACPPETAPVDFGAAVEAEARRRGLGRANVIYLVMDGAVWLWDLAEDRFRTAVKTLDFHHASEHLWAVGRVLYGEGSAETTIWVEQLLHSLRHGKQARVVRRLHELIVPTAPRNADAQEVIEREAHYFKNHAAHMNYKAIHRAGAPIGSGAVESLGAQLQRRFRCSGQFWQRPGLSYLLKLAVTFRNKDDPYLWN